MPNLDYSDPLSGIATSIMRALVTCMDAQEVVDKLLYHWSDMQLRDMLCKRLAALSAQDVVVLELVRSGLNQLLETNEATVTPKARPALDATIRRLALLLTPEEQISLAPTFLSHRRAARRYAGTELLRAHPELVPPTMKQVLLDAYKATGDVETLTPLSRIQVELNDIAPTMLEAFEEIRDANGTNRRLREQARIFERLVVQDLNMAIELGQLYPTAFVYGVGRAQCKQAEPYVVNIVTAARQDREHLEQVLTDMLKRRVFDDFRAFSAKKMELDELLRLGAWALGQLQARDALNEWAEAAGVDWFEWDVEEEDEEAFAQR